MKKRYLVLFFLFFLVVRVGACELLTAQWDNPEGVVVERYARLTVEGTDCDGLQIDIVVWEDDLFGDDIVVSNPGPAVFVNGIARTNWLAEYQCDGEFIWCWGGKPENYYIAILADGSEIKSAEPLLIVSPSEGDGDAGSGDGDDGDAGSGDGDDGDAGDDSGDGDDGSDGDDGGDDGSDGDDGGDDGSDGSSSSCGGVDEVCDGDTVACVDSDGYEGSKTCKSDCSGYSSCSSSLSCGDGVLTSPPEECDSGFACPADQSCSSCQCTSGQEICGNGLLEVGEACDDGNVIGGDGCSAGCSNEIGWVCDILEPTKCNELCGDEIVVGVESCDGTNLNGESCQDKGFTHGGTLICLSFCDGFDFSGCIADTGGVCGDDSLDTGEGCDDGNTNSCDGCMGDCSRVDDDCGDGIFECNEECDDGDNDNGDGCSSVCEIEGSGPVCGNGIKETGEPCDDGNTVSGDGCMDICFVESGWDCVGDNPTVCSEICGDGNTVGDEICDGNKRSCDAGESYAGEEDCSSNCLGWESCVATEWCGDDLINGLEYCDGNSVACYDGSPGTRSCLSDCSDYGSCVLFCGNGVIDRGEQCEQDSDCLSGYICQSCSCDFVPPT